MYDIDGVMDDALSAQKVQSDERHQELVDEVLEYFSGRNTFATEVISYDSPSGKVSSSTTVWNDDIRRALVDVEQIGEAEILIRGDGNRDIFIGLDMGDMLPMIGGERTEISEDQYIYLEEDDLSEFMDYSLPENRENYEYIIQNGDVLVDGDMVIFECYVGTEDVDWFGSDDFSQDTTTDGVRYILAYSLEEERPVYNFSSVQNTTDNNIHVIETFLYGVSFDFYVPSVGDDNVVDMRETVSSIGAGGLGSHSFDDVEDLMDSNGSIFSGGDNNGLF